MECPNCGAEIEYDDEFMIVCPECECFIYTRSIDEIDDQEEDYDYEDIYDEDDDIPEGCLACGGDYPYCADSCPMFD